MSFSSDQKKEIMQQQYKNACCRRALLFGIVFSRAILCEDGLLFSFENSEIADFTNRLIKEFYSKELEEVKSSVGGRRRLYLVNCPPLNKYVFELTAGSPPFIPRCLGCKTSFVRGVFLGSGKISDPEKQFLLEFTPAKRERLFLDFFLDTDISLKSTVRRGVNVIYTKHSSVIEDFFAVAGMNNTAFILMNSKINNDFRNNTNRIVNCETNNINRAVSTSVKQVNAIRALAEANLLSSLPEELEKTARLRLENEGLSLSQLAMKAVPPISKPGLSHRLNRIMEIADKLLEKQ